MHYYDSLARVSPHFRPTARRFSRLCVTFALFLFLPLGFSTAAQLKEAKVTQVIKDVKLLPGQAAPRPASVSDEVKNGTAVRTGVDSRAELTFTDQTLTRLGANTIFSFNKGTRNLQLSGGAMLLRVPKDVGGARINTAAVTAAITGTTIMLEYHPNDYIKFIVLEGTGRIFRNDRVGESVLVHAGQMLIVNPKGKGLPDPVDVDVNKLMHTSLLINGFAPLASEDLIAREIEEQTKQKSEGQLVETNLAIFGGGTIVSLLDPTNSNALDQANASGARQPTPSPIVTPPPPPTPGKYGTPIVITSPNPYVINGGTTIQTDPAITTNDATDYGKIYRGSTIDGPASAWAFGSTSAFDISSGFDNQIGDSGGAAFKFTALKLTGNPTIDTTNGQINLGLIAVNGITSGGPGGVLTFAGIRGLLLATVNGSITLGPEISFSIAHDLTIYARGANSDLTLGSDIDTGSNVNLYAERDMIATSNITTDQFNAVAGRDISISKATGISGIQAPTMSFNAGNNINIGGAFDTDEMAVDSSGDVTLTAGNDIASSGGIHITRTNGGQGDGLNITLDAGNDLTVGTISTDNLAVTVDNSGGQLDTGGNIDVQAGGNLTVKGDASFTIQNTTGQITNGGNLALSTGGDLTVNNGGSLSLTVANNDGGQIGTGGDISITTGGNLTTGLLTALINNGNGGSIGGSALINFAVGGSLGTGGDATFQIFNNDNGDGSGVGTIGSNAMITVAGMTISSGGSLETDIFNDSGGDIVGNATIIFAASGDTTAQGGANFQILNSAGTIGGNATINVSAANIAAASFLALIDSSLGGTIRGATGATISLTTTGDLVTTTGDATFNILNTDGTINNGANITLTVGGDMSIQGQLNLLVANYDKTANRAGQIGGSGDILVTTGGDLTADSISAYFQNRGGGSIGSDASLILDIGGALTTLHDGIDELGTPASLSVVIASRYDDQSGNTLGSSIGGDATLSVQADSASIGGILIAKISNRGGTIDGNALVDFSIIHNLTATEDATWEILNDGGTTVALSPFAGTIHGNATIEVSAADITAASFRAQITNQAGFGAMSGGVIDSAATVSLNLAGNLTTTSDATFEIFNEQRLGSLVLTGGYIGSNATLNINAANISVGGDLIAEINNNNLNGSGIGGTIGGNATLNLNATDITVNSLNPQILNANGGMIGGEATINVTAVDLSAASYLALIDNSVGGTIGGNSNITSTIGGNLTLNGDGTLSFTIANNSGGSIDMGANVLLTTGGDLTASSLLAFINNRDSGSIGGDASVLLNVGGALTTTGDTTVVISGRDDGGGAGSIGGNGSVILTADSVNVGGALVASISEAAGGHLASGIASVNVAGDIMTGGALTFSIQNGGLSQIGQVGGGTIDQGVQVLLNAANVTTGDFLLGLISNTDGGRIGGRAALALDLTGNLNAQGDATIQIDNSTTMGTLSSTIGSDATLGVAASNFTAATVLAQIINEGGGTIGGNATIGFAIAQGLTSLGDVTFEILNDNNDFGGGTIAGDATITVGASTLSAASLLAQINNSGGSIGGASSILFAIGGALTTTGDADFHILGDSLTTPGATIAVTVGSFNIGGSLSASIGAGQTFFNFDNVTINATNGITVGDQFLVQGNVTAGGNISAVNGVTLTGGSLIAGGNIISSAGAIIQNATPGGQIGIINAGGNIFAAGALDAFYFDTSITAGGSITASDVGAVTLQAGGNITIGQATGSPHSVIADTILASGAFNLTNVGSIQSITSTATGGIGFTPDPFTLSARTISSVGPAIPALLFEGEAPDPTLGNDNPGNGGNVTLKLTNDGLTIGSTGDLASIDANGGAFATDSTAGGNGGNVVINAGGNVSLSDGDLTATTGLIPNSNPNGGRVVTAGDGGTVGITAGGTVDVNSTIQVSSDDPMPTPMPVRRSSTGGNVSLTSSKPTGVAINVSNSGQLLALLDAAAPGPGGTITILATGASSQANVQGTVQADRGTIDIQHTGASGQVQVAGVNSDFPANLRADVVKVGALGENGTLTVGNAFINADTMIKLYAPGSNGELNFIANATLSSGTSTILAANRVTIQPSVVVNIQGAGGPAQVYTNDPNYSGFGGTNPSNGTFTGNGAANPAPLASAPPFGPEPGHGHH